MINFKLYHMYNFMQNLDMLVTPLSKIYKLFYLFPFKNQLQVY